MTHPSPTRRASDLTQHQSGVAVTASYVSKLLKLEAGVTPLGFPKEHVTGRIELTPRLSTNATARIWADRKPVTDSIIAYAGTDEPRSGAFRSEERRVGNEGVSTGRSGWWPNQ